jgi:hypothetical protein
LIKHNSVIREQLTKKKFFLRFYIEIGTGTLGRFTVMFNNARLLDLVSDDVDVLPLVERVALGPAQQVLHSSHCIRLVVRLPHMGQI